MYSEHLHNLLTNFARKITGKWDVDDLVQQTFLKMYDNQDKFNGKNINGWACTILRNEFINHLRNENKYEKVPIENARNLYTTFRTDEMTNIHYLENQINSLSVKLKVVFNDLICGYNYEEICERQLITLGTVKSRIFHARKILTKIA